MDTFMKNTSTIYDLRSSNLRTLTFAHSPDPDDAYMFYGFASGAVKIPGYQVEHHLEDIQSLNERAQRGEFEITAVSAHAYAYVSDRYWVLSCGASVGRRYGPILVARPESEDRRSKIEKVTLNKASSTIYGL